MVFFLWNASGRGRVWCGSTNNTVSSRGEPGCSLTHPSRLICGCRKLEMRRRSRAAGDRGLRSLRQWTSSGLECWSASRGSIGSTYRVRRRFPAAFAPVLGSFTRGSVPGDRRDAAPVGRHESLPPSTPCVTALDRVLWALLSHQWRGWRSALHVVRPATVLARHRRCVRLFWTWKGRHRMGRPAVSPDVRALIREMSTANPMWGAPRIHGQLLKLGISVRVHGRQIYATPSASTVTTVADVSHQSREPDHGRRPLRRTDQSHSRLLFVLVILAHDRRQIAHSRRHRVRRAARNYARVPGRASSVLHCLRIDFSIVTALIRYALNRGVTPPSFTTRRLRGLAAEAIVW